MSRAQTIFSELCVAMAIANTQRVEDIENVDSKTASIYKQELLDRGYESVSTAALAASGKAIRAYLIKNGIEPRNTKWTGRENIGSTVSVAKDIEVANYRISVKENADVFINGSPITIFEDMPSGLFAIKRKGDDWFLKVAKDELQEYFVQCKIHTEGVENFKTIEDFYKNSDKEQRRAFGKQVALLHRRKTENVLLAYSNLCQQVSAVSADIFNVKLDEFKKINSSSTALLPIFNYFFRVNGIKYVLAGTENKKPFAVVLESTSDWIKKYKILGIVAAQKIAGQPEVLLSFKFKNTATKEEFTVDLKIEIRWAHGKFCGNPEAKVYKNWSYGDLRWSENIYKLSDSKK